MEAWIAAGESLDPGKIEGETVGAFMLPLALSAMQCIYCSCREHWFRVLGRAGGGLAACLLPDSCEGDAAAPPPATPETCVCDERQFRGGDYIDGYSLNLHARLTSIVALRQL